MKQRVFVSISFAVLLVLLSFNNPSFYSEASFEQKALENPEEWFISSEIVNVTHSYPFNLFFVFEDETTGLYFYPRLSFVTSMNLPMNFTSYLNENIRKDTSEFGVQISNNNGNFSIGLNGTIIIDTPHTEPFFIDVIAGEHNSYANFPSLMGENLTIPLNFNPIIFHVGDLNSNGVEALSLILAPQVYLTGSIYLEASILGENLTWVDGNEIYFNEVTVEKKDNYFNTTVSNINLIFENISLSLDSIATSIILHTTIGSIQHDLLLDFTDVEWSEGGETAGEIFIFLLNYLFDLKRVEFSMFIDSAPYSFATMLMVMVIISGFVTVKKRRKDKR